LAKRLVVRLLVVALLVVAVGWFAGCWWFASRNPVPVLTLAEIRKGPTPLPPGFSWGTATSAHQIEGGTNNDWTRFEALPGKIANGDRSAAASDHWNRMASDVALMKSIGANAYRFSVEWSRLEPVEGTWNEEAFLKYKELLSLLKDAGIRPMVTLLHFTLPIWIADRGGVTAPDFPERFGRFSGEVARRFGKDVDLWCTINEPNVVLYLGYLTGDFPPEHQDPALAVKSFAGMLRAHARAAAAIRANDREAQIGVAMNLVHFEPASRWNLVDWTLARAATQAYDWAFGDSIHAGRIRMAMPGLPRMDEPLPELLGTTDYFGVNYYTRQLVSLSLGAPGFVRSGPGKLPTSDMGDEMYPEGLLGVLRGASRRYGLPIYITENGMADAKDDRRAAHLRGHVLAVEKAMSEGIPVRGFFYWSLMDNFEWKKGYGMRFGLFRTDFATQERTPTSGAEVFARLAPSE
jgi:beta-glucosidase